MGNTKKKRKSVDEIFRKVFKRSAGFMWSLMINVIIVFVIIKTFSLSFHFGYAVFGNVCKDPNSKDYKLVEIDAENSIMEIGEALEDADIIDSKYVFWGKVKVKGYGDKIVAGEYALAACMTYDEILDRICHIDNEKKEEKKE